MENPYNGEVTIRMGFRDATITHGQVRNIGLMACSELRKQGFNEASLFLDAIISEFCKANFKE